MSTNKKVLFITYDGLTDPLGQSQILPYLIGLAKKGHDISILSCEKKEAFELRQTDIQKICIENKIEWKLVMYRKRPPVLSTLLDLREIKKEALAWHTKKQFDVVHCRTILPTLIGLKLQKRGVKLIFDIRGFWADERVDGKLWSLKNPIFKRVYWFVKQKEKLALQKADHVITLTQAAKAVVQDTFGLKSSKIDVVPCTVDLNHFKRSDLIESKAKQLKKELSIGDDNVVLCYSGSLGTRYLIEEMLQCFVSVLKQNSNALFLIITHHQTDQLKQIANKYKLENYLRITSTDYSSIPAYLAMANLGLYFIFAGNSGKAVSPTKQAEFLSLGIPVITNAGIGDSKLLIQDKGVGVVLNELNSEAYEKLATQIDELLALPKEKMMELSEQEFNLNKSIETYHQVYSSI